MLYYWIDSGQLDRGLDEAPVRYTPRPPVACKIDRYREIIQARLSEYPRLSATRLFDEIRAAGYVGGYTQVKDYVCQVRPIPPPDPVVRFETPPGLQAQVDFAEFRLPWGKRFALLVVLGYSRLMWLQFYPRQTMAVLMRGLEEAFAAFGGVPAELLFDQLKAVIIEDQREIGGRLLENSEFLRFAAHWGFRIRACRDESLRERIQIGRLWRQSDDLKALSAKSPTKPIAVLCISIENQIPLATQKAVVLVGDVSRDLHHP